MTASIALPDNSRERVAALMEIVEACRTSAGIRAAYCRQLNAMMETGRQDGSRSIVNMLYGEIDKLASHLFSPTSLQFTMEFEHLYPKEFLERGKVVGQGVTRTWSANDFDMLFGQGVFEALKFGACIFKQRVEQSQDGTERHYGASLVLPWQFGVFNEAVNDLDRQPAMVETTTLTMPEVWRRIWHLPDAEKLYRRIKEHATRGQAADEYSSFFHQLLSTSSLSTGNVGLTRPIPGGIVNLNNDPNYAILGPEVAVDLVKCHEIWAWRTDAEDYATDIVIEPDILLTRYKRGNLMIGGDNHSGLHPYTLIQPNKKTGYIWGRSELADMIEPQGLLSTLTDDAKRLFGLQIDKILAFTGFDGVTDETYDQMRAAGYFNGPPGANVTDLTPKFPPETLNMINFIITIIHMMSGMDNALSGKGEPGVRSAEHSNQLMKMASPRMRDRALLVERQCAKAAHLTYKIRQAKEDTKYWTDPSKPEETGFLLTDLPEDAQVCVDSHSSSPIFKDSHEQSIAFGVKAGFLDGHYAIDNIDIPNKEEAHVSLRAKEAAQKQMLESLRQQDPEAYAKVLSHSGGHR